MKKSSAMAKRRRKAIKKKRDEEPEYDQDDEMLEQEDENNVVLPTEDLSILESPEAKRLRLAKNILQSIKPKSIAEDSFFLGSQAQNKQQDEVNDILKEDYLKKKNMLYNPLKERMDRLSWGDPVLYKGHTACITAVETCPNNDICFFSCSKDGSLIKWDRTTGKKTFLTMGKDPKDRHEVYPITTQMLCMSINANGSILATGSADSTIQLWDAERDILITTMKSHSADINGIKFGIGSNNNLCSVSSDRTLKIWDALERTYIDTFYGHRDEGLDIDSINADDFITSGKDEQVLVWKTEKQTQTIFSGHDYAIDRVRTINSEYFLTGSQDGGIFLWTTKKKKPIYKMHDCHKGRWICSLSVLPNTDMFVSGSYDGLINIYQVGSDLKAFRRVGQLPAQGIMTDLKLHKNSLFGVSSDEHRLGRWMTERCRNHIKVFTFKV